MPDQVDVILVDGVDTPAGAVTQVLTIDGRGSEAHPRLGLAAWTSLLGRSREIVMLATVVVLSTGR